MKIIHEMSEQAAKAPVTIMGMRSLPAMVVHAAYRSQL